MIRVLRTDVAFRILLGWLGGLVFFGLIFGDLGWGMIAGLFSLPCLLVVLVTSLFLGDRVAANPFESMLAVMASVGVLALPIVPFTSMGGFGTLSVTLPAAIIFLTLNWKWRLPETLD